MKSNSVPYELHDSQNQISSQTIVVISKLLYIIFWESFRLQVSGTCGVHTYIILHSLDVQNQGDEGILK